MSLPTQALPPYLTASTFTVTTNGAVSTGVATVHVTSLLPTQQLPPYLSASTFTATANGVVSTGVSTVRVPITYFGPSIPLGTDGVWTFGGSTSPAPTSATITATPTTSAASSATGTATTGTVITGTATTGTATTGTATTGTGTAGTTTTGTATTGTVPTGTATTGISSTPTAVPTSTTSGTSTASDSGTPSTTTGAPTATSSAVNGGGVNLRRALPGIIIAAIVALLAILLILVLWRYRRRRISRAYEHPNLSDFVLVDSEGQTRIAGEGAPRPTGEEEDSFLRRSGDMGDPAVALAAQPATGRLVSSPPATSTPPPEEIGRAIRDISRDSPVSAGSPFFHASDSSLFFNPRRGTDPTLRVSTSADVKRESSSTQRSSGPSSGPGPIIPTRQLMQIDDEWQSSLGQPSSSKMGIIPSIPSMTELGEQLDQRYGTPLPPPPVLNPGGLPSTSRLTSQRNSTYTNLSAIRPDSPGSEPDERATLLTARRVTMRDGGPSTLRDAERGSIPSSWGSSLGLGLGGLTRLSRLSWFQRMENLRSNSPTSPRYYPQSRSASPQARQQMAERTGGLHVPRPLSHLSAGTKSSTGETVFHDARSTLSARSGPAAIPLLPPRTFTPPVRMVHTPPIIDDRSEGARTPEIPMSPPAYASTLRPAQSEEVDITVQPSNFDAGDVGPSRGEDLGEPREVDILDMPIPAAFSPFSTTSSRGGPQLPPGLEQHLSNVHSWRESSSDMPSPASLGTDHRVSGSVGSMGLGLGALDVLEEEPPRAREGWTHLRAATGATVDSGRRTTLGQPILIDLSDAPQHTSEQGSLYSQDQSLHSGNSHLSPFSPVGSRAPSGHTFLGGGHSGSGSAYNGSGSSRRSHSASSLQHSGSVSSDGRQKPRRDPGELSSPPASGGYSRAHGGGNRDWYGYQAGGGSGSGSVQIRARLSALGGLSAAASMPQLSPFGSTFAAAPTSSRSSSMGHGPGSAAGAEGAAGTGNTSAVSESATATSATSDMSGMSLDTRTSVADATEHGHAQVYCAPEITWARAITHDVE